MFKAYRFFTYALSPFIPLLIKNRLKRGKEDETRIFERYGYASKPRPEGKLIHIHCASIGEMNAALPLLKKLEEKGFKTLLTTMTKSSADLALKQNLLHQYIPFDTPQAMKRFFDHWKPDLTLLFEQEIWLNMLFQAPLIGLINARMSRKSYLKWRLFSYFTKPIFQKFAFILAQNETYKDYFISLGGKCENAGNLKFEALNAVKQIPQTRPTWLAASTHKGEEELILKAHLDLKKDFPELLTFICPRHAERGEEIKKSLYLLDPNLKIAQISKDEIITQFTEIVLIDVFGALNTYFPQAPITFMGKSLIKSGGQNPLEAMSAGSVVVHGKNVSNFQEMYDVLDEKNAAIKISKNNLAKTLKKLLEDVEKRQKIAQNATNFLETQKGALEKTLKTIEDTLK